MVVMDHGLALEAAVYHAEEVLKLDQETVKIQSQHTVGKTVEDWVQIQKVLRVTLTNALVS